MTISNYFHFFLQQHFCKQVCGDCTCHCSSVIDFISVLIDTLILLARFLTYFLRANAEFTLHASRKSWGCGTSQPSIQSTSGESQTYNQQKNAFLSWQQVFQWDVENGGDDCWSYRLHNQEIFIDYNLNKVNSVKKKWDWFLWHLKSGP